MENSVINQNLSDLPFFDVPKNYGKSFKNSGIIANWVGRMCKNYIISRKQEGGTLDNNSEKGV